MVRFIAVNTFDSHQSLNTDHFISVWFSEDLFDFEARNKSKQFSNKFDSSLPTWDTIERCFPIKKSIFALHWICLYFLTNFSMSHVLKDPSFILVKKFYPFSQYNYFHIRWLFRMTLTSFWLFLYSQWGIFLQKWNNWLHELV